MDDKATSEDSATYEALAIEDIAIEEIEEVAVETAAKQPTGKKAKKAAARKAAEQTKVVEAMAVEATPAEAKPADPHWSDVELAFFGAGEALNGKVEPYESFDDLDHGMPRRRMARGTDGGASTELDTDLRVGLLGRLLRPRR